MAAPSEQAREITRPLHLVLRCLYNADHKLTVPEIAQQTRLAEHEVQAAVKLLQQHERAEVDRDGRIWLTTHNPEVEQNRSTAGRDAEFLFDRVSAGQQSDHSTIPFRTPPEAPASRVAPDEAPRCEPLMGHWRSELIRRPADADELARIQRSVIDTLRELDAPPTVLDALERIARLLEGSNADSGR